MPHAPLLLPEVNGGIVTRPVRDAARSLDIEAADVFVIVSPHGPRAGVYARAEGDLRGFGIDGIGFEGKTDPEVVTALASEWGEEVLYEPADFGATVALALLPPMSPVILCALADWTSSDADPTPVLESAQRLAGALASIRPHLSAVVVASGHTSAALSAAAPLTERPEGHHLAEAVSSALDADIGRLATIPANSWRSGGGCGAGPLTLLGHLFPEGRAEVAIHDQSMGVGYLVAAVR